MKKILSVIFSSLFLVTSAYAGGMIGIKAGTGDLEGKRTSSHDASGGLTEASRDSDYGAIFIEASINDGPVSFGLEVVPMEGIIDADPGTSTDVQATVSDLTTLYALVSKEVDIGAVYAKLGYSRADVTVKSNYIDTTITNAPDSLEGPVVGIGLQIDVPTPIIDIIRLEGTYTQFEDVEITSTSGTTHTRTGELDLTTYSISLARSF